VKINNLPEKQHDSLTITCRNKKESQVVTESENKCSEFLFTFGVVLDFRRMHFVSLSFRRMPESSESLRCNTWIPDLRFAASGTMN